MIPADSEDIKKEYKILLNELKQYNPELLNKPRILAITKSDMLDEELEKLLKKELPRNVKSIFISSVTNKNIQQLKDLLWEAINGKD
jgi:GTP-binding protein